MQPTNVQGAVIASGQGKHFNLVGHAITAVLTQQTTGGQYYVFQVVTPPGMGLPPHVHQHEDEIIYLIEGELEILLGDQTFTAHAGDSIFFPRHLAHAFHNVSSKAAKAIFTVSPGASFEAFFDKLSLLPPGEPDMVKVVEIFAEYGMEILLPKSA